MANLSFYYGTMASGKTTKLLQDNYNYRQNGKDVIIMKPFVDTKGGNTVISRTGNNAIVDITIGKQDRIASKGNMRLIMNADVILVDEAQFLSIEQIKTLWLIAHVLDIPVVCYGLKSDFKGMPFDGTIALIGLSDYKNELTVNCECGQLAVFNARKVNGEYVLQGDTIAIDGTQNVSYVPLCSECYLKKVIGKDNPKVLELKRKIETK